MAHLPCWIGSAIHTKRERGEPIQKKPRSEGGNRVEPRDGGTGQRQSRERAETISRN